MQKFYNPLLNLILRNDFDTLLFILENLKSFGTQINNSRLSQSFYSSESCNEYAAMLLFQDFESKFLISTPSTADSDTIHVTGFLAKSLTTAAGKS